MTEEQEVIIQTVLRTRPPEDGGLWTKTKAHASVAKITGIELPDRTFGSYMERWGFNPVKLLRKSYRQDPIAMKTWMAKDYPAIALLARHAGAEILWLGQGTLPMLRTSAAIMAEHEETYIGTYFLHASNNRGHIEWVVSAVEPGPEHVRSFLEALLQSHEAIELIIPNGAIPADPAFTAWHAEHGSRLNIRVLPALRRSATISY